MLSYYEVEIKSEKLRVESTVCPHCEETLDLRKYGYPAKGYILVGTCIGCEYCYKPSIVNSVGMGTPVS